MDKRGYYDVHCHILPEVDDGSQNMEMTRKMLEIAYTQGIRCIIATPHYISGKTGSNIAERMEIVDKVREVAASVSGELRIELGNELYYSDSILEDLQAKKAATMCGSDYVLVEFSTKIVYKEMYRSLRRLIESGYRPIIAHVERYDCLFKKLELIQELVSLGAYIQMNAESLVGRFMDGYASYCRKLFMSGMVHLLGSDAHGIDFRPPFMEGAIAVLQKKKMDEDLLERILYRNPERIFQNKYI